jgi:hypothetical protein
MTDAAAPTMSLFIALTFFPGVNETSESDVLARLISFRFDSSSSAQTKSHQPPGRSGKAALPDLLH